jgi:hypothetical protein
VLCAGDFIRINLIWYKTKKEAIDAAAGRAVDCFRHRSSDDRSHQRYCSEIPYTIENSPVVWKSVSERAQYLIAIFYFGKRFLHYLETLGKEEILDQQEL